jgi:hypothetical protein
VTTSQWGVWEGKVRGIVKGRQNFSLNVFIFDTFSLFLFKFDLNKGPLVKEIV